MRTTILLGLSLACLILLGACQEQGSDQSPRPVQVSAVTALDLSVERRFPGRIHAMDEVRLGFEVPGRIRAILVKPGDRVVAGQPLAQLEEENFRIAIEQAQSAVAAARAQAAEAQAAFARAATLRQRESIAEAAYEQAQAAADAATAQLAGAEANLEQAEKNKRDTTLLAPYDGLIAERLIEDFSQVQAKQAVFILQAYDRLRVTINVPEAYVLSLTGDRETRRQTPPQAAVQFVGHSDHHYNAEFDEVATTPDPQTLTWALRFVMPTPEDLTVLPGMSCMVRLVGVGKPLAPMGAWVPVRALTTDAAGEPALWLVDEHQRVRRQGVSVGPIHNDRALITKGIEVGQLVVVAGLSFMRDDLAVMPQVVTQP